MRKIVVGAVVAFALAIGLWLAFGRSATNVSGDGSLPLAYVPGDTPYLLANLEPFPREITTRWMEQLAPMAGLWQAQLDSAIRTMEESGANTESLAWMRALSAEIAGKSLSQVFDAMGYDMHGRFALYGIGLAPVLRVTLADPARFEAFIASMEKRAGSTLPRATLDGTSYWHFGPPDARLRGIVAIQNRHLVLTLAPLEGDDALRTLLGIEPPASDMRKGETLVALNRQFGYLPSFSGYVDVRRAMQIATADPGELESEFLKQLGVDKPKPDAICAAEYAALAEVMPRLSMGYVRLDATHADTVSRIELRPDIAKDLMKLRAPMPGLGQVRDAPFNLGLSLRVAEIPALMGRWADAATAAPWKCAALEPLNAAFAEGRQQAANPALFAVAPVFHGFHAILTRLELKAAGEVPEMAGKLLLGSNNPAALIGMAKSVVPQIAGLQIKPDGVVHALPPLPEVPATLPAYVAMRDKVLGLAFGTGQDADLAAYLEVDPAQQPLLVVAYSGAILAQFSTAMRQMAALESDPAARAEGEEAAAMMEQIYGKFIKRVESRVELTESGVEMHQTMLMH